MLRSLNLNPSQIELIARHFNIMKVRDDKRLDSALFERTVTSK